MKIELEQEDIQAIAIAVVDMIKPLLNNRKTEGDNTIFDVEGLAEYLKVDASWVYKQVSYKAIPYFKSGKYTRFKKSAIDKWIDNKTVKPIPSLQLVKNRR